MAFLKGIGPREAVALIVLAVSLAITFAFCNPKSTNKSFEPRTPESQALTLIETSWNVTWLEGPSFEDFVVIGQGELAEIELDYPAGPFPDTKDDNWGFVATTNFTNEPGRYLLYLSYKGEIGLQINGEDKQITPSPGEGSIVIPFDQSETAPTPITVRYRDSGGPAHLSVAVRH
jgi:hypothetical protein